MLAVVRSAAVLGINAYDVTVNPAPANMRKEGTAFDLPMALALLVATGQLRAEAVAN